jgi:hypothetical protein
MDALRSPWIDQILSSRVPSALQGVKGGCTSGRDGAYVYNKGDKSLRVRMKSTGRAKAFQIVKVSLFSSYIEKKQRC